MALTKPQRASAVLLKAIDDNPGATIADLARAADRKAGNLSRDLERLAASGWIVREPGSPPVLTDAGRDLISAAALEDLDAASGGGAQVIALHLIDEDPELNPRKVWDTDEAKAALADLAASIGDKGVLQPIVIRPAEGGRFKVVIGARRFRASLMAGQLSIPAVIEDLDDDAAHEAATAENIQRADMSPLDEANAFNRIIAARMAKDPSLKLKDAKETIAQVVRKSIRFVELRLDLRKLPEIKQVELNAGAISVTDAKKYLQARPKAVTLSDGQWLIALEILDRQTLFPYVENGAHLAEVGFDANLDANLQALIAKNLALGPDDLWDAEGFRTGRYTVRLTALGREQLAMKFGDVAGNDSLRQEVTAGLRPESNGENPPIYLTPWLEEPFTVPEALAAEIAAQKADWASEQAAEAKATQERAEAARAAQESARVRMMRAATLDAEVRGQGAPDPLHMDFAALIRESGKPLPWSPTGWGGLVAADGATVLPDWPHEAPDDVCVRVSLIAVAVNAAAGLVTPAAGQVPPSAEIDGQLAAADGDALADPEPDEEDDEDDPSQDPDVDDSPEFLRRLAGCKPADEARP